MKQKIFALGFLMMAFCLGKAQNMPAPPKRVQPKTFTVKLQTREKSNYGFLAGMNDSTIKLSSKRATFSDFSIAKPSYKTYNYADIETVGIRKHGQVSIGILCGGLIGGGFGAVVGRTAYNDNTHWFGPIVNQFCEFFAAMGLIIGAVLGSQMIKFNIHGDKAKFKTMKSDVLEMSLRKSMNAPNDSSITN